MKKEKVFKLIMLILVVAILAYLTVKMLPLFEGISEVEGRETFKEEIENLGYRGVLIIVGLMLAQIFLAFLPGEPVEILAGMCYGPIGGLLIIFLGSFISSLIIFFAVRKFGRGFIYSFVKKEQIDKLENSKIFSNNKAIEKALFFLFFIPGTPKDLMVYIGGLLPIKPSRFILISTFARFPSIISSTIAGSNIIDGNWKVIAGVYIVTFLISGILLLFWRKKNKQKELQTSIEF